MKFLSTSNILNQILYPVHLLLTDPENSKTVAKVDKFHLKGNDYKTLNGSCWLSNEVSSTVTVTLYLLKQTSNNLAEIIY